MPTKQDVKLYSAPQAIKKAGVPRGSFDYWRLKAGVTEVSRDVSNQTSPATRLYDQEAVDKIREVYLNRQR